MSVTAEVQTRPSLDHLPYETRVRIAVAETQGATWEPGWWCAGEERTRLRFANASADEDMASFRTGGRALVSDALPDYLHDPAAWGALMERELNGWRTDTRGRVTRHQCTWDAGAFDLRGPWADNLPLAVCLAVLAKYGITVEP